MEANGGLTLLSTLVSCRRKRDQDCMWLPTTLKRQLQWRKAGRMSKQSRGNRIHRSMSLELHRRLGHSTRTLARHSRAVFLSMFEMHMFTRLDYLASSVGCFVSVSFSRSFFASHAFLFPVVRSFILFLCLLT